MNTLPLLLAIIDPDVIHTLAALLNILVALQELRRRRRVHPARNPSRRGARLGHAGRSPRRRGRARVGSLRSLERRSGARLFPKKVLALTTWIRQQPVMPAHPLFREQRLSGSTLTSVTKARNISD